MVDQKGYWTVEHWVPVMALNWVLLRDSLKVRHLAVHLGSCSGY